MAVLAVLTVNLLTAGFSVVLGQFGAPAFGMTGYALGPTLYILLINVYFQQEWLANAQATGLSVKRAQHAVNGPGVRAGACVRSWIGA